MRREVQSIGLTILIVGLFFTVMGIRIYEAPYKVPYQVEEEVPHEISYQVEENVTHQVPINVSYQVVHDHSEKLLAISNFPGYDYLRGYLSLPPMYHDYVLVTMKAGQNVSVRLREATTPPLPIDFHVFTEENYQEFKENSTARANDLVNAIARWMNCTGIDDRFSVNETDTYVVVAWNRIRTLFPTTVYISDITLTASWKTYETKYRIEYKTEYRLENVTKYKTEYKLENVTRYRTEFEKKYDFSDTFMGIAISAIGGIITLVSIISKEDD